MSMFHRFLTRGILLLSVLGVCSSHRTSAAEMLPPGFRPLPPSVHALVGATVVIKPGDKIENATIVLRDGLIKEVGQAITPPPDARIWDMKGMVVYAGFIDPYLVPGSSNAPVSTSDSEPIAPQGLTSGRAEENFFGVPGQRTERGNP